MYLSLLPQSTDLTLELDDTGVLSRGRFPLGESNGAPRTGSCCLLWSDLDLDDERVSDGARSPELHASL